jgi:hypothetical protein
VQYKQILPYVLTFFLLQLRLSTWLPGVIFGVASLIGGISVLFLTETVNKPLPEKAEQIKHWHADQRFFPCMRPKQSQTNDVELDDRTTEI